MATISDNSGDHFNKRPLYGEDFPQDLWFEVFVRSSVESLLRVKRVCTRWRDLVSNTNFINKHLQFQKEMSKKNGSFLLVHNDENDIYISNIFLFDEEFVTGSVTISSSSLDNNLLHSVLGRYSSIKAIEGPINGLYCVYDGADKIAIWNPATKEVGLLPLVPKKYYAEDSVIGFCVDPSNEEDYKVVLICTNYQEEMDSDDVAFYRMLYTTNTNTWRIIHDNDDHDFAEADWPEYYTSNNTLVNGTYYWLGKRYKLDDYVHYVLAFDTSKAAFRWISTPSTLSENNCGNNCDIALLNDDIYLFNVNNNVCRIDIWLLMVGEDIWIKKYTSRINGIRRVERPLGFWRKYDELLLVTGDYRNGQTTLYNTTSGEITNIGPQGFAYSLKVLVYYESLVSPRGGIIKFNQ